VIHVTYIKVWAAGVGAASLKVLINDDVSVSLNDDDDDDDDRDQDDQDDEHLYDWQRWWSRWWYWWSMKI